MASGGFPAPRMSISVHDLIGPALAYKVVSTAAEVTTAMVEGAHEVETYAKENAPWDDRTGNARNGLTADVGVEDGMVVLSLAHTVDYGIWLETIQDGAFAIIMPTLEALGPRIIEEAGGKVVEIHGGLF